MIGRRSIKLTLSVDGRVLPGTEPVEEAIRVLRDIADGLSRRDLYLAGGLFTERIVDWKGRHVGHIALSVEDADSEYQETSQ